MSEEYCVKVSDISELFGGNDSPANIWCFGRFCPVLRFALLGELRFRVKYSTVLTSFFRIEIVALCNLHILQFSCRFPTKAGVWYADAGLMQQRLSRFYRNQRVLVGFFRSETLRWGPRMPAVRCDQYSAQSCAQTRIILSELLELTLSCIQSFCFADFWEYVEVLWLR